MTRDIIEVPIIFYDEGKYQEEKPVYDFEEMANTIEDIVCDKLGKNILVTISEVE